MCSNQETYVSMCRFLQALFFRPIFSSGHSKFTQVYIFNGLSKLKFQVQNALNLHQFKFYTSIVTHQLTTYIPSTDKINKKAHTYYIKYKIHRLIYEAQVADEITPRVTRSQVHIYDGNANNRDRLIGNRQEVCMEKSEEVWYGKI